MPYSFVVDFDESCYQNDLRWFDNAKMKFVTFKSYSEKCTYILTQFGIPKEWSEALNHTFPARKWTVLELQMFSSLYRKTDKTLEEAIAQMKKFLAPAEPTKGKHK